MTQSQMQIILPDYEQQSALQDFANHHGHCWKSALIWAWECGQYRGGQENIHHLQRVRNTCGTRWLNSRWNTIKPNRKGGEK